MPVYNPISASYHFTAHKNNSEPVLCAFYFPDSRLGSIRRLIVTCLIPTRILQCSCQDSQDILDRGRDIALGTNLLLERKNDFPTSLFNHYHYYHFYFYLYNFHLLLSSSSSTLTTTTTTTTTTTIIIIITIIDDDDDDKIMIMIQMIILLLSSLLIHY